VSHAANQSLPTVSEAATLLGVSERTIRRTLASEEALGERLVAEERRTASGVRAVRLVPPDVVAELATLLKVPLPTTPADTGSADASTPADAGLSEDAGVGTAGHTGTTKANGRFEGGRSRYNTGSNTGKSRRKVAHGGEGAAAMVEQLRGEVERLNRALERSQTLQLQQIAALQQEQERVRLLEGQNAKLIEALPTIQNRLQEAPEGPEGSGTDKGGVLPVTSDAQNDKPENRPVRRWWQLGKK